jgi:hypothetical protein
MRLLLLLTALPLWAADDANTILRRYLEADKQNDKKAEQYTFVEERAWFGRDRNGEFKQIRSETAEMIFVEGQAYRRLVARNGKPLDAKEKAKVDKDMRETAEHRRKHPAWADGGGVTNGHDRVDLGSDEELLTLFDNHVAGEEEIGGRKAWVIESTPRKDHPAANRHEKDVASFNKRLWIDEVENAELRAVYTVIGDHIYIKPGSTFVFDFQKVNQDAWQLAQLVIETRNTVSTDVQVQERVEIRYSDFKKFDVQSTITIDK